MGLAVDDVLVGLQPWGGFLKRDAAVHVVKGLRMRTNNSVSEYLLVNFSSRII